MNLEWKAAELYEFVKQYNKSDDLNVYTDIADNTLSLCFEFKPNPPQSEEIRSNILQKCREKFAWLRVNECLELNDISISSNSISAKPNPSNKTYSYSIIINNDLKSED